MSSNRSLLFIAGGVIALVVLAVAVVLLAGDRKPQAFPPNSPEAALQDYVAAWDDHDIEAAYGSFSERVRSSTTLEEYQRAADEFATYGMPPNGPDRRVFIDEVTGSYPRVVVHLTVEELYGDGLSQNVQRSTRSVAMVRDPDGWRIDQPLVWFDPMASYEYSR